MDGESLPPTEYKRMLSWQLSHARDAPVVTSRKRQKKLQKRKAKAGEAASAPDHDCSSSEGEYAEQDGSGYAYLVVNSEGEEEWYYSAPESPVESGDEPWDVTRTAHLPLPATDEGMQESEVMREAVGDAALPPQEKKRGGRAKKKKKKTRSVVRLAEVEFFGPLCDLVESTLSVEVDDLQLPSQVEVPSLAELCVRCVQQANLVQPASVSEEDNLPFLIHALLGAHRDHRSLASTHIRWLERLLAALELPLVTNPRMYDSSSSSSSSSSSAPFAYCNHWLWDTEISLADYPDPWMGLHLPLPFPQTTSVFQELASLDSPYKYIYLPRHFAALLHFTNYLFPLFTARGRASVEGWSGLSPSQLAAVAHVNSFITSRYKELCLQHSETLKLWPAYVYWARGQLRLAATSFSTAIDSLKHNIDKGTALGEMGRMFLTFGDRSNARHFFSKILEVDIKPNKDLHYMPTLTQVSVLALEASIWDCGWLNTGAARQAVLAWSQVLREAEDLPSGLWYLHLAACESQMMVHAGRPVGSDPSSPLATAASSSLPSQWLSEVEELVGRLCSRRLILHFHLSLIYAMAGRREEARRQFLTFYDDYAMFRTWADGLPGNLFSSNVQRHLLNPWNPLVDMLRDQGLPTAPVLQLQWRTRLLHPMYPYAKTSAISYLADHCSAAINLRLTGSGLLTADAHMDLPPLRCVFLDPYTGSLCFSRSASFHHHYSGQMGGYQSTSFNRTPDEMALPWPVRVLEVGGCVVELVMSGGVDLEACPSTTNHSATLHWHRDGEHSKLDLRVAIRKELKKAILRLAADQGMEGKEDLLKAWMERGLNVTVEHLKRTEPPSKYSRQKPSTHASGRGKGKAGSGQTQQQKSQRIRNYLVHDFSLRLTDHLVFGEATLALCFSLLPQPNYYKRLGQVLVFMNCTSQDSFQQPRVHCVGDDAGFQYLYPSHELAVQYAGRHLPHVRYVVVCRTEKVSRPEEDHWQLVFDQDGSVVHKEPLSVSRGTGRQHHVSTVELGQTVLKCSLGERVYNWTSQSHEVTSYSPQMNQRLESVPFPSITLLSMVPIPGLLLVHTPRGLSLIHPGSLMPVEVEGLVPSAKDQADTDEEEMAKLVQIQAQDATVNILCVYNVAGGSATHEELPASDGEERGGVAGREGDLATEGTGREEAGGREGGGGSGEADEVEKDESVEEMEARRRWLSEIDFGSCHVALTMNNRLLILHVPHRTRVVSVLVDILLPGKVTEIHPMGRFGFMLSATQFPDCFREEVYWLSESGKLLGMLPCLGPGPRSFTSATLEPRASTQPGGMAGSSCAEDEEDDGSGLYVFFSDGQGGVCCIRPSVE